MGEVRAMTAGINATERRTQVHVMAAAAALVAPLLGACSGSGSDEFRPVPTFDFPSPTRIDTTLAFVSAGLGWSHSCMITETGAAYCWGANEYGQLGSSEPMQRCLGASVACSPTPLRVEGLPAATLIDGSVRHTCALDTTGAAWCWGFGQGGQLGDGRAADSLVPVAVAGGLQFAALDVGLGGLVTCALTPGGAAYCWGPGNEGGLGNGSTDGALEPVEVVMGPAFSSIAVGDDHACAIADGAAHCWGRGAFGKLGLGAPGAALVPTPVAGGQSFGAISVGLQHSCALTDEGLAWCWGFGNTLGNGGTTDSNVPVAVSTEQRFRSIHAGFNHTCALTDGGDAWCWGDNFEGALGDGSTETRLTPVSVRGGIRFRVLAAGLNTCGIATDGAAYCWGDNSTGAIAQPDVEP